MPSLYASYKYLIRIAQPYLRWLLNARLKKGKEDRTRIQERMGIATRPRPTGSLIWVHAASVGEAQSALILIHAIGQKHPAAHILVTTGTVTSATLMEKRLPAFAFHQYIPLDHPDWTAAFLNHWKPDLAFWMESELWPSLLMGLKERNVPAVLINARLSEQSFGKWQFARNLIRDLLSCFTLIIAQTPEDAERFITFTDKRRVSVCDNIKYGAAPLPYDAEALAALKIALGERPLWVYASTHAGEESLACRIHKSLKETIPDLLTILVPRHPERREEISGVCFENNVKYRLRGHHAVLPSPDDDLYIADTLGELGLFYSLCPIAMIGRSFSDDGGGGHNPVEAAKLGCAVITGPNNQYQRQLYDDMQAMSAVVETKDEIELAAVLKELITEPHVLESLQRKTSVFITKKTHVIDDILKSIEPLLAATENRHAA